MTELQLHPLLVAGKVYRENLLLGMRWRARCYTLIGIFYAELWHTLDHYLLGEVLRPHWAIPLVVGVVLVAASQRAVRLMRRAGALHVDEAIDQLEKQEPKG